MRVQDSNRKPGTSTAVNGLDDPDMGQEEVDPEIDALEDRIKEYLLKQLVVCFVKTTTIF